MNPFIAFFMLLTPAMSFGYNDFFSDQCSYPQKNYPIEAQDEQHSNQVYSRDLERSRSKAESLMPQINADLQRARKGLEYYFPRQWADAMMTHMDNGLDCCDSKRAVSSLAGTGDRRPAGSDVIDNTYEVVDPTPLYEDPNPEQTTAPQYETPTDDRYSSSGGLCLQTGFAASTDWNQQACRNGGKIDPEVCGDSAISKYPQDYKQCVDVLEDYYRLSYQKRRLASEIQAYNGEVSYLRGGRSEVKPAGSFLGPFLKTVGPFLLVALLANQSQKSVRHQYQNHTSYPYNSSQNYGYSNSSFGRPNSLSGRYANDSYRGYSRTQQQAPYYGENYGYPLQNGGILGQILPALMTGAFGCSQGTNGAGNGLARLLSGGNQNSNYSRMPPYAAGGLNGRYHSYRDRPYSGSSYRRTRDSGYTTPRGSGLSGQNRRDAFFYSKMRESEARRERLWSNDVYSSMGPTSNFANGDFGSSTSTSGPAYSPGTEFNTLLQSLMGGGRARANFSLDAYTGY